MNAKVILITGASSGIGESAAKRLLEAGHTVYAAARRTERMQALADAGAHLLKMDVTDDESMQQGVDTILKEQGRIDVLVNNAGYGFYGALETVPIDEARKQFEVNVFGLARLCQLVIPGMRERKDGRIVNIASMAGHFCEPHGDWYHATKYAVVGLNDCMRMDLRNLGIKVVKIEPGAICSEWADIATGNMLKVSEGTVYEKGARKQAELYRFAYKHFGTPADKIGRTIYKACTAHRPRLTYRRGFGASFLPALTHILPARWFDALAISLFG